MRVCVLGGGVAPESSFANGGQLSYNYVAPLADPAVLPKLLGWLLRGDSALRFVPRPDLRQWRWSLSFLRACRAGVARLATPGGNPLLGATAYENLWHNSGHGALGFTLACGSAKLVADSITQRKPELDVMMFH